MKTNRIEKLMDESWKTPINEKDEYLLGIDMNTVTGMGQYIVRGNVQKMMYGIAHLIEGLVEDLPLDQREKRFGEILKVIVRMHYDQPQQHPDKAIQETPELIN